jgi:diguanylate cyclase (GGDEF)-like protein/PAS domain S-box-containing protein
MTLERSRRQPAGPVLVITENVGDAKAILDSLERSRYGPLEVEWVSTLADGIDRLKRLSIEAILLDLSLPDSQGIQTFDVVSIAAPGIPILVLCDANQEDLAQEAVRRGAQDYLPKDRLDNYSLPRAVRTIIGLRIASEMLVGDRERAGATLNSIGDAVLSSDVNGKISYLNAVAEAMTGWKLEEALGRPLTEVFRVVDRVTHLPVRNPLELAIQQDGTVGLTADCLLIRRDGVESAIEDSAAPIRDRDGRVVGAVLVFRDVGKAQALAHKMSHLAQHDFLTGLPNRVLLDDRLRQAIRMEERHHKVLAVLFVDLDNFKPINDSLGHAIGDALLQAVASRLLKSLRDMDTVSRHGGDEFVILLPEIESSQDAVLVAEKILGVVAAPHMIEGHEVRVTASIGVGIYPAHGRDAEGLVHCADLAMYEAKKRGGNRYHLSASASASTWSHDES